MVDLQQVNAIKRGTVTRVSNNKRLSTKAAAMSAAELTAARSWEDPKAPPLAALDCSVNLALTEGPGQDGTRQRETKLTFVVSFGFAGTTDGRRKPTVCYLHSENIGPVSQFLPEAVSQKVVETWVALYEAKRAEYEAATALWLSGKDVPNAMDAA